MGNEKKAVDFAISKDECKFFFDDGSEQLVVKDSDEYKKYFAEVTDKEATPPVEPAPETPVVEDSVPTEPAPEPPVEPAPDTAADVEMTPPSEVTNDETNAVPEP